MNSVIHKGLIQLRVACEDDIDAIYRLLSFYADEKLLLRLSKNDVRERLPLFVVAIESSKVVACVSIRDFGESLFEVRSLAVDPEYVGRNIGTDLVTYIMNSLAKNSGIKLFALTYSAHFFEKLGFTHVDKELFPQKIWSDCNNCPKQNECDEEALMIEL
jgi:amino-acid N-acetyltransferase